MNDILRRSYSLDGYKRADGDSESSEYEFKLSSEEPVEVWRNEFEILEHSESAVDMGWIGSKNAPLLYNHDRSEQIGVITSARLDDGFLVVRAKFSNSDQGQQKRADVEDDILRNVSVGYRVNNWEQTKSEDGKDTFTVTDWTPLEASLVTIPADKTVGFGRSEEQSFSHLLSRRNKGLEKPPAKVEPTVRDMANEDNKPPVDLEKARKEGESAGATAERERVSGIQSMVRSTKGFDLSEIAEKAIHEGESVSDFNKRALEHINKAGPKLNQHDIGATPKEQQRYSLHKVMEGLASGDMSRCGYELDMSNEVKKRMGKEGPTVAIPHDVLLRGWVPKDPRDQIRFGDALGLSKRNLISVSLSGGGQSDTVSNIVETELMDQMFIASLRETSVLLNRGVTMIPNLVGDIEIPIELTNPDFEWIGEDAEPTEGDYSLGKVSLGFKTIAARIPFTRRAEKQSTPGIEGIMTNSLRIGAGLGLEKTAWSGTASATEPGGILGTAGIGSVTTTASYARNFLVELRQDLGAANAPTGNAVLFMDEIAAAGYVNEKVDAGSGQFVANYSSDDPTQIQTVVGPGYITNLLNQANTGIAQEVVLYGDPSSVYIGTWGTMELDVDNTTKRNTGGKTLRVFLDADIDVPQPARWSAIQDL